MSIKSLFNLKKDYQTLKANGTFTAIYNEAKKLAFENADKQLEKSENKESVVKGTMIFASTSIATLNPILAAIILEVLPIILNFCWDSLTTNIHGITESL